MTDAVRTFRKLYKEAQSKRAMLGMDNSGDSLDDDDDQDQNLDDALAADDLPRRGDRSAGRGDMADDFRKRVARGAEDEAEDEGEDESEDEDEGAQAERQRGYLRARCAKCGETLRVIPPKNVKLVAADSSEAEGESELEGKRLAWKCAACSERNVTIVPKRLKLVKRTSEASRFFRETYARARDGRHYVDDPFDAFDDPAEFFARRYRERLPD